MVDNSEIEQWLQGKAPDAETVEALRRELPWWTLPAAMRLRNCKELDDNERASLSALLAATAPDPEQMSMAVNHHLELDLARFYPVEQPETPSTESTIEKFLNNYGSNDPEEEALLNRLIFNPVPDYAQMLAKEEEQSVPKTDEAPEGSDDALINSFIIKSKASGGQTPPANAEPEPEEPAKPQAPVQKPTVESDSMLSESLAHIYIKRGKYAKAFEIISNLNLNFPEKSIYFADQLRFLSKLMAIEERKSVHTENNNNKQ